TRERDSRSRSASRRSQERALPLAAPVFFDDDFFDIVFDAVADGLAAAFVAIVLADDAFVVALFGVPTTSDCPGKITGRRRPFARMSCAVVMWYFFATPPIVSPDFTTWVDVYREDE